MRLSFNNPHLSISSFETVELPRLAVVTGPNGVGKTHLLKAIATGQISTDVTKYNESMIRFVDNALVMRDAETITRSVIDNERDQVGQAFFKLRDNARLLFWMKNAFPGINGMAMADDVSIADIRTISERAITDLEEEQQRFTTERLDTSIREAAKLYFDMIKDLPHAIRAISSAASGLGIPVFEVSQRDVEENLSFGTNDFLEQSFSRVFMTYYQHMMTNRVRRFMRAEGESIEAMSDEEFILKFGSPPWELMNDLLGHIQPDLEMNRPTGYPLRHFTAYLRRKSNGRILAYSMLSSGERVLFTLCATIWNGVDERIHTIIPKVLLLDEVDATLHPSWVPRFFRAIKEFFVERMGMHVMVTTHSPTTIALADEDSIFVMHADPRRLRKASRNQAIAELTTEVPFLSLGFDGRRQVFVEAPSDAVIYEKLYAIIRRSLDNERSLQFISVGTGDAGSGCDAVCRVVNQLVEAGNATVFGLLDWDGENEPSDRIKILAHGKRNGLENVLLDPFLIACLIVRDVRYHLGDLGLTEETTWSTLADRRFEQAPGLATSVQDLVLGAAPEAEQIECAYQGGLTLNLRRAYLEYDDHALEAAIKKRFQGLRSVKGVGVTRNAGALCYAMVTSVLADRPELIPREIVDVFRSILEA